MIILKGEGRAFCAGFDLSPGLYTRPAMGEWDPTLDYAMTTHFARQFMSLWYSRKPTIAQVHGWCVARRHRPGAVLRHHRRRRGRPHRLPAGPRLGLAAHRHVGLPPQRRAGQAPLLTGDPVDGTTAERIGLIYKAVPADRLERRWRPGASGWPTSPSRSSRP